MRDDEHPCALTNDEYRKRARAQLDRHRHGSPQDEFQMGWDEDVVGWRDRGAFVHCWVWVPDGRGISIPEYITHRNEWVITETGEELREMKGG